MNQPLACPKCRSEKIVPKVRVVDRGHANADSNDLSVVFYESPDAFIFKGKRRGILSARVCGECGYAELYLENPGELYDTYQGLHAAGDIRDY